MSSYLHPENAKRVQQIQDLVCLESEREAVNLIIALAWQEVFTHLVDKVGLVPAAPALPQPTDSGNTSTGHHSNPYVNSEPSASSDQGYLDNGYLPPNHLNNAHANGHSQGHNHNQQLGYGNGHGYTNGYTNGHSNGHGHNTNHGHPNHGHSNGNGYSNGREAQLFTTLRDVEF